MRARVEASLHKHPELLTRLRRLLRDNPTFAKAAWTVRGKQLVVLDYPVTSRPRYGFGRPAHPMIESLLDRRRDTFAALLTEALAFVDDLASLPSLPVVGSAGTSWHNGWLPALDMVANYSLLAKHGPRRYLEIGSGESTKLARKAIVDRKLDTEIISIDPAPRAEVDGLCDRVVRSRLEDADLAVFDEIEPGDMIFFDGSHRCFMNSDVAVFFLDVLPRLPSGVLVGIHDIDLPWDYRPEWIQRYYSEQYMLAAHLLAGGRGYSTVEFASRYAAITPELRSIIDPLFQDPRVPGDVEVMGGAFWMTL